MVLAAYWAMLGRAGSLKECPCPLPAGVRAGGGGGGAGEEQVEKLAGEVGGLAPICPFLYDCSRGCFAVAGLRWHWLVWQWRVGGAGAGKFQGSGCAERQRASCQRALFPLLLLNKMLPIWPGTRTHPPPPACLPCLPAGQQGGRACGGAAEAGGAPVQHPLRRRQAGGRAGTPVMAVLSVFGLLGLCGSCALPEALHLYAHQTWLYQSMQSGCKQCGALPPLLIPRAVLPSEGPAPRPAPPHPAPAGHGAAAGGGAGQHQARGQPLQV